MEFSIVLGSLLILMALIMWAIHFTKEAVKASRTDDELLLLCVDQLMANYSLEELEKLEELAVSHLKDPERSKRCQWEDLLRRIQIAFDEKKGVIFAY